jgi:phosphatidylglycerol:prolipoprotein diacylglycerol transferase
MFPHSRLYWVGWGTAGLVFGLGGALALAAACRKRGHRPTSAMVAGPAIATLLTLLGARLHPLLADPANLLDTAAGLLRGAQQGTLLDMLAKGDQRIAGGLLLATGFLACLLPRLGQRLPGSLGGREILDTVVPVAGLSMAVGRLGCLAGGCCFGKLCTGPTCLSLAGDSLAWWNHFARGLITQSAPATLPLHPVALYLALAGLLAAAAARLATHQRWPAGAPTLAFLLTFCGLRLCIELFRETVLVAPIPFQTEIDTTLVLTSVYALQILVRNADYRGREAGSAGDTIHDQTVEGPGAQSSSRPGTPSD